MTLRDRFYLRFFLFHKRYGRMLAALLEGLCIFIAATLIGLVIFSLFNLAMYVYGTAIEQRVQQEIKQVQAEKVKYEKIIVSCLNDGGYKLNGKMRPCNL